MITWAASIGFKNGYLGKLELLKYKNYERIFVCGNFLCILLLVGGHIYNTTKPEWASK